MKLKKILSEMIKAAELKGLKSGDTIYYYFKGMTMGSIPVEFLEYIPKNSNVRGSSKDYDILKVKTDETRLNPDKDGILYIRTGFAYLDDPEYDSTSSKKGFLSKGVHGSRKFGK